MPIEIMSNVFIRAYEKRLPADDSLFPQREGISYWDCSLKDCIVKILGSFHIFIIALLISSV